MTETLLFHTRSYAYLAGQVGILGGFTSGEVEVRHFSDGERYQRLLTPVANRDVILLGGTISDEDTLELYDLACTLVSCGTRQLTLVIPYFGYSTMERAVKAGEAVTAKTRARLLSSIPPAGEGNQVLLVDLHAEGIPHYFEGAVRPTHVYTKPVLLSAIRRLAAAAGEGEHDYVLGATDAGRAKWVESLANDLGVAVAFVFKKRDGERTRVTAMSAHVQDRYVILYDDMIRSGGTLMNAASAYLGAGARRVAAVTTHGLFVGDSLLRLRESGLFEAFVATDTHPRAVALAEQTAGAITIESVAGLLAEHLRRRPFSP